MISWQSKNKAARYTPGRRLGERYSSYSFSTSALDGIIVSVTPRRALTRGKDPRYPFDRRLGVPQSWSGHRDYRKKVLDNNIGLLNKLYIKSFTNNFVVKL
jgi:hypothetical protein